VDGFRFLLMLDGGEPADSPAFVTAIPPWREG
jgi:hypothetical protein